LYLGALFVYDIQTTALVRSVLYTHSSVIGFGEEKGLDDHRRSGFLLLLFFFMMNEYFSTFKFERAAILLKFQNGRESDGVCVWVCVFPGTLEHLVWRFKSLLKRLFLSCNSTS
jgi:hypothetical protein